MCELFAVSAAKKIYLNDYLYELRKHSSLHPHGWGMAFFDANEGENPRIVKEPVPAYESEDYLKVLENSIEEAIFLAHIRLATVGHMVYENCHPFLGKDKSGRTWTVMHNGTIFKSECLEKYREIEKGSTDSERIALYILECANKCLDFGIDNRDEAGERFKMMDKIVLDIVKGNKLNLMVYDGELLYVHTNMKETLFYKEVSGGKVFATSPLDTGEWEPLPMMQLFAYKEGKEIFSGTKHDFEYFM